MEHSFFIETILFISSEKALMADVLNGYHKTDRAMLQHLAADGRLSAGDWQVLAIALAKTKNPGDPVGLGIDYLAQGTGLGRRTVIRCRKHLVDLGYLVSGDNGARGLAYFRVATGVVDGTCRMDATGVTGDTGTGVVDGTRTGVVDGTQMETGNKETINPLPLLKKTPRKKSPKAKTKATGKAKADAEAVVDLYADLIKPRGLDQSGSRSRFVKTVKALLAGGQTREALEGCIRNFLPVCKATDKSTDYLRYRKGCQSFFGPKDSLWCDYLKPVEIPHAPREDEYVVSPEEFEKIDRMGQEILELQRQGKWPPPEYDSSDAEVEYATERNA